MLPPYLDEPTSLLRRSPYDATPAELVARFSTSAPRREILRGYLEYRAELRAIGFGDGFQWLDGSFVEDVESTRGRPPMDLDVVTFYRRPAGSPSDGSWEAERWGTARDLFYPPATKARFRCDGYFVSLSDPEVVDVTAYWYGLFSHSRNLGTWKGMVRVALAAVDEDEEARRLLRSWATS